MTLWTPGAGVPEAEAISGNGAGAKDVDSRARARSHISRPVAGTMPAGAGGVVWFAAAQSDLMTAWGSNFPQRDRELREFIPSENFFASALSSVCVRNANFSWEIVSESASAIGRLQEMLQFSDEGEGWHSFVSKISQDLYSQDKGAFIEIVRVADSPTSEVIGLNHLDAAQCYHTNDPDAPVIYQDRMGLFHRLQAHEVITLADFPTPIESFRGHQMCAETRVLRAAQIMRNIAVYEDEKTGGRHTRAVHLVTGVDAKQIQDGIRQMEMYNDGRNAERYMQPAILSPLDLEQPIDTKKLELTTLPDGFDQDVQMKWYIAALALGFQGDYQDFAPLPGGNLGTSAQSEVLHMKSRGKGPAMFMKLFVHALNWNVMPQDAEFVFAEQDIEAEVMTATARRGRAETRKLQVDSGEITPEIASQVAVDDGDLAAAHLQAMGRTDITPEKRGSDTARGEKDIAVALAAGVPEDLREAVVQFVQPLVGEGDVDEVLAEVEAEFGEEVADAVDEASDGVEWSRS